MKLVTDVIDEAVWPKESQLLPSPDEDAKQKIETEEMIDVCMRDEHVLDAQDLARRQGTDVTQIEQQRLFLEEAFYIDGGITEPTIDKSGVERRAHRTSIRGSPTRHRLPVQSSREVKPQDAKPTTKGWRSMGIVVLYAEFDLVDRLINAGNGSETVTALVAGRRDQPSPRGVKRIEGRLHGRLILRFRRSSDRSCSNKAGDGNQRCIPARERAL
jgi:hypothetical protein